MDQDDDQKEGKTEKSDEMDLGALERDLLEYQFSEKDDGEVDGNLLLMTPSSFKSPAKEAPALLIPSGTNKLGNGLPEEGPTETAP